MSAIVYIGIGTNMGERQELIHTAIRALKEHVGALLECSSFYETEPWGFTSEHQFLNAAASFRTSLSPEQVLTLTQRIELSMGRLHKSSEGRYADRPIDLDLLLYSDVVIRTQELTLPHPHLHKRAFVLDPLAEIAPNVLHPTLGKTIQELQTDLHNHQKE